MICVSMSLRASRLCPCRSRIGREGRRDRKNGGDCTGQVQENLPPPARGIGVFVTFFHALKSAGVPVTLREYLTLMEAMERDLASRRVEAFYHLSRAALVKDERHLDKFDRVFGAVFKGLEFMSEAAAAEIPAEWLRRLTEKYLTEEEKKEIE